VKRLLAIAALAALAGCSNTTSSVSGVDSVNGEAWYVKTTSFVGLVFGSDVYYCPPPESGPAKCTQARMVPFGDAEAAAKVNVNSPSPQPKKDEPKPDPKKDEPKPAAGEGEGEGEDSSEVCEALVRKIQACSKMPEATRNALVETIRTGAQAAGTAMGDTCKQQMSTICP
jgi:hypothetical protein